MDSRIPVLIVGAGPTGLMMACELARHGIDFRIIDKKPERTLTSNAVGIQPRTLELFDQIGISNRFLKHGNFCSAAHLHIKGESVGRIPFNQIDSPYKFALMLSQSETERLLNERLEEFKKEVERPLELVDIKQDNQLVISTILFPDGHTETMTSDWLIACDGSNSLVRQKCHIKFPGKDISEQFMVADTRMDSFLSNTELHVFFDKGTIFAVFPIGSNTYRIAANLHQESPRKFLVEKEVKEIVNERSYGTYIVSAASWISPFWIHSKMVDRMRDGSIFLAGDAAHIHSPVGGQGMNTGIQDAYNLAWKLALVVKGIAKPSLLETYQMERYPIINKIVRRTERFTKAAIFENPFLISLRNLFFKVLFQQPKVLKKIAMMITQLSFQYKNSPIIDYDHTVNRKSPRPGKRAPDVMITATTRLFDYLRHTQHHVLLFIGPNMKKENLEKIKIMQASLTLTFPDLVKVNIITPEKIEQIDNDIIDAEYKIHHRYGAKSTAVFIIRPDNYIAYTAKKLDVVAVEKFLKMTMGSIST